MIEPRITKLTPSGLGFNSRDPMVVIYSYEWKKMYSDEVDFLKTVSQDEIVCHSLTELWNEIKDYGRN